MASKEYGNAQILTLGEGYWIEYDSDFKDDEFISKDEYRNRYGNGNAPLLVHEKRIQA